VAGGGIDPVSLTLLLIGDGRERYRKRCLASARRHLPEFVFEHEVEVDDSDHQLGFAGAIRIGWAQVTTDWVLHVEEDFVFTRPVPVEEMIHLLRRYPYLAQVALKRQPVSPAEIDAGGVVELHSEEFTECNDKHATWVEHRRYFTTNPSIYPSRICDLGWPQEEGSERAFTDRILQDPINRFAIWGRKFADPMVTHIGDVRAGHGY
jgi:hypothetical protein